MSNIGLFRCGLCKEGFKSDISRVYYDLERKIYICKNCEDSYLCSQCGEYFISSLDYLSFVDDYPMCEECKEKIENETN